MDCRIRALGPGFVITGQQTGIYSYFNTTTNETTQIAVPAFNILACTGGDMIGDSIDNIQEFIIGEDSSAV
jgi:hypothetical protein